MNLDRLASLLLVAACALPAQTLVGPDLYFFVDDTSFSAEGSWIPSDPKNHAAYQSETELECKKHTGECVEATADYFSGHSHISVVHFQIVKWDRNGIIATSAGPICVTRTVSIGFAAKHISDNKKMKVLPKDKQQACDFLGVPTSETWTFALKNSKGWATERDRDHRE